MGRRVVIATQGAGAVLSPDLVSRFSGQFTPFERGSGPPTNGESRWVQLPLADHEDDAAATIDRLFHRARYLTLASDGVASGGGESVSYPTGKPAAGTWGAAVELAEMADERGHFQKDASVVVLHSESFPAGTNRELSLYCFTKPGELNAPLIYLDEDSGLYYAPFTITGVLSAGLVLTPANSALLELSSNPDDLTPDGSFLATIDGTIEVEVFFETTLAGDGAASISQLDFTIDEFWPYAYMNGDPVWNTATGARVEPNRPPEK